jgi:hypothetical protein
VIFENDFVGRVPILGRQFSVPEVLKDVHGKPLMLGFAEGCRAEATGGFKMGGNR